MQKWTFNLDSMIQTWEPLRYKRASDVKPTIWPLIDIQNIKVKFQQGDR